jgi:hypothetical protein
MKRIIKKIRDGITGSNVRESAKRAVIKCVGNNRAVFSLIRQLDSVLMGYKIPPAETVAKTEARPKVLKHVTLEC